MEDSAKRVLEILRQSGTYVSGQKIADSLGLSRTAVWKGVRKLRTTGYTIEAVPNRGYRLLGSVDLPISDEIRRFKNSGDFGCEIVFMKTLDSTNDLALMLASQGACHGTVVTADGQTSGRGRKGRKWVSPSGENLYISIVLRPPVSPAEASQIPILSVMAILRTMRETAPDLSLKIKWPNDVFAEGKKISGTLCEMKAEIDRVDHVIVGVGVNVNMDIPENLLDTATSMKAETGRVFSRPELAALLLDKFENLYSDWLGKGDLSDFQQEWRDHSMLLGRQVDVRTPTKIISGWAAGIDPEGALKLEYPDGRVRYVYAGDASLHGSGPVS